MAKKISLTVVGSLPFIPHSDVLANPLDPRKQEFDTLTAVPAKQRTLEQHWDIAKKEWTCAMYWEPEIGPYIPVRNLFAAIRDGAKKVRKGPLATAGLMSIKGHTRIPLVFDGPRDLEELWEPRETKDPSFRYVVTAVNGGKGGGRVPRCRPIFKEWGLRAVFGLDEDVFEEKAFAEALVVAGQRGIGDERPKFGRFTAEYAVLGELD